jgi:hypothetical protein
LLLGASSAWAVPDGFWDHWGDGQAEVSAYAVTIPRYGALRQGEAVLVVVTETFTYGQRVKSDGGRSDEFPVLKLHASLDFQTGIYDYDTATSVFVPLDGRNPDGLPTKVAFASEEWCGSVYDQFKVDGAVIRWTSHSYFDGEADRYRVLPVPEGGVLADALPLLVRGLGSAARAPGERREMPVMPPFLDLRLRHDDPVWQSGSIARDAATTSVDTALGPMTATVVTTEVGGTRTTWTVEDAAPHRLLGWTRDDGFAGTLTGSTRMAYWTRQAEGDERNRIELGLPPDPWHPPAP